MSALSRDPRRAARTRARGDTGSRCLAAVDVSLGGSPQDIGLRSVAPGCASRSQAVAAVRRLVDDPLYRGSLALLGSNVTLAGAGFVFWMIATNSVSEQTIGRFSGINGALTLLVAVATLGLPTVALRFLPDVGSSARVFVANSLGAVASIGLIVSLAVAFGLSAIPGGAGDAIRAEGPLLLAGIACLLATGSVCGAALVAGRATGSVLLASVVSSTFKVLALVALVQSELRGMLAALAIGAAAQVAFACAALWSRTDGAPARGIAGIPSERARFAMGSYLGGLVGCLPVAAMPLLVLSVRGPVEAAYFGTAWLIVSALGFIAGATSQAALSEMSRRPEHLATERRRALRYVYCVQIPLSATVLAAAPLLMGVFGSSYAEGGTTCLRLLCLGSFAAAANYVFDAVIAVGVGGPGYFAVNAINVALVLGGFAAGLPFGLAAASAAWAVGQCLALVAALLIARRVSTSNEGEQPWQLQVTG